MVESALEDLEDVQAEEEDSRDNTPENLQGTDRYVICEEACDSIAEAVESLEDAINAIDQAVAE